MAPEPSALVPAPIRFQDLPGDVGLPYIGIAHRIRLERAHLDFEAIAREHGPLFQYRFLGIPCIGVVDAEIARAVFQDRPDAFRRPESIERDMGDIGLLGVFAAEGKDWRRQRRLINPSFHAVHLDSFAEPIERVTERLRVRWCAAASADQTVDVVGEVMRYTMDITTNVAFGRDFDTIGRGPEELQDHLAVIFRTLNRRIFSPVRYWKYLPFVDRAARRSIAKVHEFMRELVDGARGAFRDAGAKPGARSRNLLEAMVAARDDTSAEHPLTDEEIVANVFTLLLAGEDTTANTIAWALHYLATKPSVFARARAEVDAVLGDAVVPRTSMARDLPYVDAIAQEALRLKSPAPFMGLHATRDTTVGNVAIPKGASVALFTRLIATSPKYFGDPESFRPERWLDDAPEDTRPHNPRAMMPFGFGPRICPGRGLAMLEAAMVIAMVVRNFDLSEDDPASVGETLGFAMQPDNLRVRFRARAPSIERTGR